MTAGPQCLFELPGHSSSSSSSPPSSSSALHSCTGCPVQAHNGGTPGPLRVSPACGPGAPLRPAAAPNPAPALGKVARFSTDTDNRLLRREIRHEPRTSKTRSPK
ncbi:hypothetical protein NQZ68_014409, partial [Dissostichus eleginoides]